LFPCPRLDVLWKHLAGELPERRDAQVCSGSRFARMRPARFCEVRGGWMKIEI
jgi:hypothetical protein